jgi:RNA polymerase sigma factor (sigma-70 family)
VGKTKYDVINTGEVSTHENFPKYFLGDTPEEAEELHKEFSGLLNKYAFDYAASTEGVERSDLFGEALIGLARAKRDFDPSRSSNFNGFVIRKVKDALNEFIKNNRSIVPIPRYIKDTNRNIKALEFATPELSKKIIKNIQNAAKRAGISPEELIERAASLPENTAFDEYVESHTTVQKEDESKLNNMLLVLKLKKHMTDTERKICDFIMEGMTYENIGKEFGHSKSWVTKQVAKMGERLRKFL